MTYDEEEEAKRRIEYEISMAKKEITKALQAKQ